MRWIIALAIGTFASEDLTCIGAGQLIRRGDLHFLTALLGCFLGIYLGDLGLWLIGRLMGKRLLAILTVARRVPQVDIERLGQWFDRNSGAAILGSRFLPGSRLPMYVAAGALGRKSLAFAGWTFIAALIWTPLVVLAVAALGDAFTRPLQVLFGKSWLVLAVASVAALCALRIPRLLPREDLRYKLIAKVSRLWRWEFWPMWLFYLPAIPWIAWLAIRHRSLLVITAANPGIPTGGFVGESKFDILSKIAGPHVIPSRLIHSAGELADDDFPLVLKPDVGQRGAGVRMMHTRAEASAYLATQTKPVLAQPLHPGPFEAGIFYYRFPGEARGRIFSITDKRFPILTGDGTSTMRQLILRHPRLRMQHKVFTARHGNALDRILGRGEIFQLTQAGNHCQGTMFCDGAHLITPQLEAAVDAVAQRFNDFHFGRFDVRYSHVERFKAGDDFAIVELNGITSESGNLYDPCWSLVRAYRTLFAQWELLFVIATASKKRGAQPSRWGQICSEVIRYHRDAGTSALSD